MKIVLFIFLLILIIGCGEEIVSENKFSDNKNETNDSIKKDNISKDVNSGDDDKKSDDEREDGIKGDEGLNEVSSNKIIGPGGCVGEEECNIFFGNNPEESMKWCDENPDPCAYLKGDGENLEGPGDCGINCEEYCNENMDECRKWCDDNNERNPELCGFILQNDGGGRQGDGVWDKTELTFYIKDEENVLTDKKRKIIVETIISTKEGNGGFYGWNSAFEEINRIYPDNIVPDIMIEIENEENADFVISVHSVKEFCCDYTGDPIVGKERSDIGENNAKIRSNIDAYNIINIDEGFLEDMMRHEIGHGLGLFGHVVDRQNDLMSIVSPASAIKKGNLEDLYVKYRDRDIESVEESIQKDESVADRKVKPPS